MKQRFIQRLIRKSLQIAWRLAGGTFWNWSPPYEYVFEVTSERVHDYMGVPKSSIKKWCIVGGYLGIEVPKLLASYENVSVDVFECSKRYLPELRKRFGHNSRVKIVGSAVSDEIGQLVFYETSLTGSGSLLKLGAVSYTHLTLPTKRIV